MTSDDLLSVRGHYISSRNFTDSGITGIEIQN